MSDIWQMSAAQIAAAVRSKTLSATEVAEAHLARLDAVNSKINAVVQDCSSEAMIAAAEIDRAIARGEDPGVLCGVPVTIKVNVDQAGHATTNGLRKLAHNTAAQDSPVVANIRKAGGVIVGRTNTPAFSLRWFTTNGLHGQTLNPRGRGITPGGSSGGAAAAVAAGLCAVGHGTDIAGSIRYPAYACGLHGLRPSLGRIPAYNASGPDRFIGAQLMAVSGPIARSIADLSLSLAAMAAPDARDPWYIPAPLSAPDMPKRAALVLAPDGMEVAGEVRAALLEAAQRLRDAGWNVEEMDTPPMCPAADINALLWMAETQFGAAELMRQEADPDALFVFEQMSRDVGEIGLEDVMRALQTRAGLVRDWALFLAETPLVLCPVSGELPFDQQSDVRSEADFARIYAAQLTQRGLPVIGAPSLAVAMGEAGGKPVGVQLVAPNYREDILLAAGAVIEAAGAPVTVAEPDWT